jgi:hypothetical protein
MNRSTSTHCDYKCHEKSGKISLEELLSVGTEEDGFLDERQRRRTLGFFPRPRMRERRKGLCILETPGETGPGRVFGAKSLEAWFVAFVERCS